MNKFITTALSALFVVSVGAATIEEPQVEAGPRFGAWINYARDRAFTGFTEELTSNKSKGLLGMTCGPVTDGGLYLMVVFPEVLSTEEEIGSVILTVENANSKIASVYEGKYKGVGKQALVTHDKPFELLKAMFGGHKITFAFQRPNNPKKYQFALAGVVQSFEWVSINCVNELGDDLPEPDKSVPSINVNTSKYFKA